MSTPRLALLGPVLPFRGGVAQHTTMVHRATRSRYELLTISFSRPYPRLLFPGRGTFEPGFETHREEGVRYDLDWRNPASWRRCADQIAAFGADAVVIPWWTLFWAAPILRVTSLLQRHGVRSIFLCHNVEEHESSSWRERIVRWVLRRADAFLVHSSAEQAALRSLFPQTPTARHPIPPYVSFPDPGPPLPRTAGLELLFFGFVRSYKGLDILLEALHRLRGEDVILRVVGEWWVDAAAFRTRLDGLRAAGRAEVIDRYVNDAETAAYFARADAVVLPYRSATGTAVIALAYRYGTPVIGTTVGGIPDVVVDGVTGLLVPPEDPERLAEAIRIFLRRSPADRELFRRAARAYGERMTWESLADALAALAGKRSSVTCAPCR